MNWRTKLAIWLLRSQAIEVKPGQTILFVDVQCVDGDALRTVYAGPIIDVKCFGGRNVADTLLAVHVQQAAYRP